MKLWRSKTKHFCGTSFKHTALKLIQKQSTFARLPSKMTCGPDARPQHFNTCQRFSSGCFNKYRACHEKLEPRHTNSRNCHAKWSPQSNISVTWNLQRFHGFSVRGFKHRHHGARNPCACHAKSIMSDPLQNPPRLPTLLQPSRTPAPATYFATCRNPCACHAKSTLNLKKWSENLVF